jgi:CPA1 family monovalent cation:H+ antiporter
MLEGYLILALSLSLLIIVLIMLSTRMGISAPILLVIAGLCISLLPGLPVIRLRHELLFIVLLPPLLYRAAWNTC